jgi:hypothetical protein
MKEFLKALRPVKNRIRRNRFLRGSAAGLAAGLAAAAALQAAAFFVPVPDRWLWAAAAALAVWLLTVLGYTIRPVKDREAAETADACGLEERAITALENAETPVRQLQQEDACRALRNLDVKKIRPGSVKKALLAALGCGLMLGGMLLIPNAKDTEAAARKVLAKTLQEGRKTIEQAAEEDERGLPEEKKSELRKITDDLNRELGESRDAVDAMVALDRAEQRLEQIRQQTAADAMNAADGKTGKTGEGKAEGKEVSGEGSETASASVTQAGEGQQAEAPEGMSMTAAQMKTLEAMAALKAAVNPSAGQNQAQMQAAMAGMQGSQSGKNGNGASGIGAQNSGNQTGGGAGEGSTNEEQAGNGQNSGAIMKGTRDPKYKEMQYETLYDPEHIDKAKQDVMTEQFRMGGEDSVQIETGPGRGSTEGDVPWNEVLHEYADTEAQAADRENLTMQERQWVNEYFALLTEQQ